MYSNKFLLFFFLLGHLRWPPWAAEGRPSFIFFSIYYHSHMSEFFKKNFPSIVDSFKHDDPIITTNATRLNNTLPIDFSKIFKFFVFYLLHFFFMFIILYFDNLHILALFIFIFINSITHLSIVSHFIHFNNQISTNGPKFSSLPVLFIINIILASFANLLLLFFFFKLYLFSISHNYNISSSSIHPSLLKLINTFEYDLFYNSFIIAFLSLLIFILFPLYVFPLFIILAISFAFSIHSIYTSLLISNFNTSIALLQNLDYSFNNKILSSFFDFHF